jgi:branched-chain amino acid aminotransferase
MKVWMDGKIVDGSEARVPVTDHGLLYGDGIFEGIRVAAGRIFRLDQHLARLAFGAKALALHLPYELNVIREAIVHTVRALGERKAYIRLLITRGQGPLGVDPTSCARANCICIASTITLFSQAQRERGLDLITSSYRRPTADILDVRVKSLNYLGSVLAKLEAKQHQADDALMLNSRGHLTEAAVANVFALRAGQLFTPPPTDGCLEGINRRAVMEIAASEGLRVAEQSIGRSDLFMAEEVFLTGTGAGVIGVRSLDCRTIGSGQCGPETTKLARLHRQLTESEGNAVL